MADVQKKKIEFEGTLHEALYHVMMAASHIRERLDKVCNEFDITQGQYSVLRILKGVAPEGYPRGEIASRMLERAPDVTRLVDRLEERGLVERDRTRDDRRLSLTRITKKGLDLLDAIQPRINEVYNSFSERINIRDRKELARICEGIYLDE